MCNLYKFSVKIRIMFSYVLLIFFKLLLVIICSYKYTDDSNATDVPRLLWTCCNKKIYYKIIGDILVGSGRLSEGCQRQFTPSCIMLCSMMRSSSPSSDNLVESLKEISQQYQKLWPRLSKMKWITNFTVNSRRNKNSV